MLYTHEILSLIHIWYFRSSLRFSLSVFVRTGSGTVRSLIAILFLEVNSPPLITSAQKISDSRGADIFKTIFPSLRRTSCSSSTVSYTHLDVYKRQVPAKRVNKIEETHPNLLDLILGHQIDLIIDTPSQGIERSKDGFVIRRHAVETGVNCLTSLDTANALLTSLESSCREDLSLVDIAEIDKAVSYTHLN